MKHLPKISLIVADFTLVLASIYLALLIRFEGAVDYRYLQNHEWFYLEVPVVCVVVFYLFGLYEKVWRYVGLHELSTILYAITISFAPFQAYALATGGAFFPRSGFIIAWLLAIFSVGGIRLLLRIVSERAGRAACQGKRVLIVGATDAGEVALREIGRDPSRGYFPVGFIDDKARRGVRIHGIPVLGGSNAIPELVESHQVEELILALPSPSLIRQVMAICEPLKIKLKVVPSLKDVLDEKITVSRIREVQLEDLLQRQQVDLQIERISSYLQGKRVLVTGAGGSIGSEICRQVADFGPELIILNGRGENSIHEIFVELSSRKKVPLRIFIADIRDEARMRHLFATHRPHVVFHAAANKHVPLMEQDSPEAVTVNVFGTKSLIDLADENGVERFILLSTDKAVKPVSVMGASKRIAEMILADKAKASKTKYVAVRFGNVLGSRGSVIPTFRRQIALGGPVTVTDPGMTRFFMTIPEAVQLVIQAGAIGEGGEVFILDMGEPVNILELARSMIRLSGLEPDKDVEIRILGTRPGEKLTEELINVGESTKPTSVSKLLVLNPYEVDSEKLRIHMLRLRQMASDNDDEGIRQVIRKLLGAAQ
jgi:FlaA1/EpsC-like NDP-sugar epimerase